MKSYNKTPYLYKLYRRPEPTTSAASTGEWLKKLGIQVWELSGKELHKLLSAELSLKGARVGAP